jgi:hypothetical protein
MTNRIDEADAFKDFSEIDCTLSLSHFIHDDQPDFQHLTGSLGIELVWYRRDATEHREGGSPHREWEVNLEKLLGRVRSEYEAAHSRRLDVFVHPRPGCRVSAPPTANEGIRKVAHPPNSLIAPSCGAIPSFGAATTRNHLKS